MQWLLLVVLAFGPGLTPNRAEAIALLNLGIKQVQRKELDAGLESVKNATQADPSFGRAHLALGQVHRAQGRPEAAADALRAGLKVAGDDAALSAKLSYQLGAVQLEQAAVEGTKTSERHKLLKAAADALGKATEHNPKDYRAFHRRGRAFDQLDMPTEADLAYRSCIELRPRYEPCFVDLGLMYVDYGHDKVALQVLKTGVEINDESPAMWAGLGRAYLRLGRAQDAVDALNKAKVIEPDDAMIRFSLGMAHAELSDRKLGIEELQAFLTYAGDDVSEALKKVANNTIARLQYVI